MIHEGLCRNDLPAAGPHAAEVDPLLLRVERHS
jgi:hypothetical protein